MARELGISQTPIRTALVRLESEELVVKTHLVGYSAGLLPTAQGYVKSTRCGYFLRPFAAQWAAERMTREAGRELAEVAHRTEEGARLDRKISQRR
jgi:DNA-binding GntR family transcriptional regulator